MNILALYFASNCLLAGVTLISLFKDQDDAEDFLSVLSELSDRVTAPIAVLALVLFAAFFWIPHSIIQFLSRRPTK